MAKNTPADNEQATEVVERDARAGNAPILMWEAAEFVEYERSKRWYTLAIVCGLGLAILATVVSSLFVNASIFSQVLVGAVFVLATFVVIKHADDKPRQVTYSITELGINTRNKFLPFNQLKTFWMTYNPPTKILTLQSTSRFKPLTKIRLGDVDPLAIRDALKDYLPEQAHQDEDFLEKLSRIIRL